MQTFVSCMWSHSSRPFLHQQLSEHEIMRNTYVHERLGLSLSCLCRDECFSGVLLLTQLGPDYELATTNEGLSWTLCHSRGWSPPPSCRVSLPGRGCKNVPGMQQFLIILWKNMQMCMLYKLGYVNTGGSAVFVISSSHFFFINNFKFWLLLAHASTESICRY